MENRKGNTQVFLSLYVIVLCAISIFFAKPQETKTTRGEFIPTPTIFQPFPYRLPKVTISRAYRTMLVGDSMVDSLGLNANLLRQHLIEYYPDHEFVNYNYGFGATSIETLPDRLNKGSIYLDQNYLAILSQGFDLIIIESFGYNPLSQLNEGEGLT